MAISAGLVGLPNVGKSTLFNALTRSSVPAEDYPFCTIDPHLACTVVPDERIAQLQTVYDSKKTIPSTVQFTDIAGLVAGAASGEGLGNQFLSHIREVDLILHVLRCFPATSGELADPLGSYDVIMTELMLKDLESVTKRIAKLGSLLKAAHNDPKKKAAILAEQELLAKIEKALNDQQLAEVHTALETARVETIPLLCAKNFLIIANVAEDTLADDAYKQNEDFKELVARFGEDRVIPVSAKLEHELSNLSEADQTEMRAMMGVEKDNLAAIIRRTYQALQLITFFTCGPQEIHAWPIKKGTQVRQAAGEIHSDLERGFICADVFNAHDLLNAGSMAKLKEIGKLRTEGQDYPVQDGDIINVKFNV